LSSGGILTYGAKASEMKRRLLAAKEDDYDQRTGNHAIAKSSTKLPSGKRTRSLKRPSSIKPNFEYRY
jgi:hypothetical protein